jgi:hypothetical protein
MKMSWTKFKPITDYFKIPHYTNPKFKATKKRHWLTTLEGTYGGLENATLKKNNGDLGPYDPGIYWIKINRPSKKNKSKSWNYIGKNAVFCPSTSGQGGIAFRVSDHITKLMFLPHRSKIIEALEKKYPKKTKEQRIAKFREQKFLNYQELRKFLSDSDGKYLYKTTEHFEDFFKENKDDFKTYEKIKEFFDKYVEIKFLKLPIKGKEHYSKIENWKKDISALKKSIKAGNKESTEYKKVLQYLTLHVDKAEAVCMGAYAANNKGKLPELCKIDETKGFLKGFAEDD